MPIPNALRKKCLNCSNPNHLVTFCRKNKDIKPLPPKSGVKSNFVSFKLENSCFHCVVFGIQFTLANNIIVCILIIMNRSIL